MLTLVMEECAEVAQRCSKAKRFGLAEVQPNQEMSNEERILQEVNDLFAVLEMTTGYSIPELMNEKQMSDKKTKVAKYLEYSRQCGTLNP